MLLLHPICVKFFIIHICLINSFANILSLNNITFHEKQVFQKFDKTNFHLGH